MSETNRANKELAVPAGFYAYILSTTNGVIRTAVGPTNINQQGTDRGVQFNPKTQVFDEVSLDQAMQRFVTAKEGEYVVLENPAIEGRNPSSGLPTCDLMMGRKVMIPGPVTFALFPMQTAEVIGGHDLRSNEYLIISVYNEVEAAANWDKSQMKPVKGDEEKVTSNLRSVPKDLAIGKRYIIAGTEYSFYIPPTGVEVLKGPDGQYVRSAVTLERLSYCILLSEGGKKRYERGPQVVFPNTDESFYEVILADGSVQRSFPAIELNEISGILVKVIAPYDMDTPEGKVSFVEGSERFITGKEQPIYFPNENENIVVYGDTFKHYAQAIPDGTGRYVMERLNGKIKTETGPQMLLLDPRSHIFVRRILSPSEAELWYPGNEEVRLYNQKLRDKAKEFGSRSDVIPESSLEANRRLATSQNLASPGLRSATQDQMEALGASFYDIESPGTRYRKGSRPLPSQAGRPAPAPQGAQGAQSIHPPRSRTDTNKFDRSQGFQPPRTISLDSSKFEGSPTISVWNGYAVQVVSKEGQRKVFVGPALVILNYGEVLEVLSLSTGKPKTTDSLFRTVYLNIHANSITDIVSVETKDHVSCAVKVKYQVNFMAEYSDRWFSVQNYVKLLCDHGRSRLLGGVKKLRIQDFYQNSVVHLRNIILGEPVEGNRPGMFFQENGMIVYDLEVLSVKPSDENITKILSDSQMEVIQSDLDLTGLERKLQVTKRKEEIELDIEQVRAETFQGLEKIETEKVLRSTHESIQRLDAQDQEHKKKIDIEAAKATREFEKLLKQIQQTVEEYAARMKSTEANEKLRDFISASQLEREKLSREQDLDFRNKEIELELTKLSGEVAAVKERWAAFSPHLGEALLTMSNRETLVKIGEATSLMKILGGKDIPSIMGSIFENTPLNDVFSKIVSRSDRHVMDGTAKTA